jgi:hypothetical protein
VARHNTFELANSKFPPPELFPILFISPKIPPPLSAYSLAFLSGFGSILITSPVVGSFFAHANKKKRDKIIEILRLFIKIYNF